MSLGLQRFDQIGHQADLAEVGGYHHTDQGGGLVRWRLWTRWQPVVPARIVQPTPVPFGVIPDIGRRHCDGEMLPVARNPVKAAIPPTINIAGVDRTDRILMGPGPCDVYPEAHAGLMRPLLGHLDPVFLECLDETCDRLREVFRTGNALTLPLSGTGSAGMEAALVNLVGPGDPVVIGVNGAFGVRMAEVARRCGADVITAESPWGEPLDPDAVLAAHPAPKLIGAVHAETSTGVRNDIAALGAGKKDALLLMDCVTSLGGIEVQTDAWGVDVAYSGTQKCLGVPPGLSPFTVSDRARERMVQRCPSWYLDLRLLGAYLGTTSGSAPRVYHHTAPVSMIFSLHAGLGAVLAEGLEKSWLRHARCGAAMQDGLEALGFELLAPPAHRLPQLSAVVIPDGRLPDGMAEADVRSELLERYGIEIGGGLGEFAGRMWRIGCMGHSARPGHVAALLAGLKEIVGYA